MPELIYIKSHILTAISIAKRLNNMEKVIRGLEATYAVIREHEQEEPGVCERKVLGDDVLTLSSYRLTRQ